MENKYAWCTYRDWSFKSLEGIQDLEGWETGLIITTEDCIYDLSKFEKRGIPLLRIDPKKGLKEGGEAYDALVQLNPKAVFYNGWSWMVPEELFTNYLSLVLHPGKLPEDRGGSPIQNQIRRGEIWTYANLIELGKELDAGKIYARERISLRGQADDVWARMSAAGITTAKKLLRGLERGDLNPVEQVGEPTIYRRVKPEDSELTPEIPSGYAERIVRAHNETDPNSYVVPAFIRIPTGRLVVERATLEVTKNTEQVPWNPEIRERDLDELIIGVNNGKKTISFQDKKGSNLYLTKVFKT